MTTSSFDHLAEEKKWQRLREEQILREEKTGGKFTLDENDPEEILRAKLGNLIPVYDPEQEARASEARLNILQQEAANRPLQHGQKELGELGSTPVGLSGPPAIEKVYYPSPEVIQDLNAPVDLRLSCISQFLKTEDQITDAFAKLTMLYNIGSTTQLRVYLKRICVECLEIPVKHRLFMAEFLYDENVAEIRERREAREAALLNPVEDPFANCASFSDESVSEEKFSEEKLKTDEIRGEEKTLETKLEPVLPEPEVVSLEEEPDPVTLHATYLTDKFHRKMDTAIRIGSLERLANHSHLLQFCKTEWWIILANPNLDPNYRYKLCLKIQKYPKMKSEVELMRGLFRVLFVNLLAWVEANSTSTTPDKLNTHLRHLILPLKSLRAIQEPETSVHRQLELPLIKMLDDSERYPFGYNDKADLVDTLLSSTKEEHKELAKLQLSSLSGGRKALLSIYLNAQNVHTKAVEESVAEITKYLFDQVQTCVLSLEEVDESLRKRFASPAVDAALDRILIDQTQYGNVSLSRFLTYLYNFILHSTETEEGRDELLKRLGQELEEMSGTCSSGYITRLANTLSGFIGDLAVRIGIDDQMVATVKNRLNLRIQAITDDEKRDQILNEMMQDPPGKAFIVFFREHLPELRQELHLQFCGKNTHARLLKGAEGAEMARKMNEDATYAEEMTKARAGFIDDATFDLYLRKAISIYEGRQII